MRNWRREWPTRRQLFAMLGVLALCIAISPPMIAGTTDLDESPFGVGSYLLCGWSVVYALFVCIAYRPLFSRTRPASAAHTLFPVATSALLGCMCLATAGDILSVAIAERTGRTAVEDAWDIMKSSIGGVLVILACLGIMSLSRWQRHGNAIECPDCAHDLRGLTDDGICPECGAPYSREELLRIYRMYRPIPRKTM
ncbi:MAG: hypothetical protein Tsb0013_13720 [Phycisphaerales bacterium]